ncbi:MAG: glycosyltransferase family 39 protein [Rhodospirillales bacterium]|nr:glycosyltransferase family 39 protein [Rhodospirillales bacterium]
MNEGLRPTLAVVLFWGVLLAVAVLMRPPLPVDETRYLAVAWEMWRDGSFLVPRLNGEFYSHKPPLLFWLMHLGWFALGVNEWSPRLIAPAFGLGSLVLTYRLAGVLWPMRPAVASIAPMVVLGSVFWAIFTTLTMFDVMVTFFVLLGAIGIVRTWLAGARSGVLLLGLALGGGILAKGPVVLLHLLPVALLAPLWGPGFAGADDRRNPMGGWPRWYGGILAAVGIGAAIGLAWAIPAAIAGGPPFAKAIFWKQSAGRMVDAFTHGQPWWFYLVALPLALLPWAAWPAAWRAICRTQQGVGDGGMRFCGVWLVSTLLIFSAVSAKQVHYLLPAFPALALLLSRALVGGELGSERKRRWDLVPPAALMALVGAVIAALALPVGMKLPWWTRGAAGEWGLALAAAAFVLVVIPPPNLRARVACLASLSILAGLVVHLAFRPPIAAAFDLRPIAGKLAQWEREGRPLAFLGKYHGQFHFLGRLEKPMGVIGILWPDEKVWVERNPNGLVVSVHSKIPAEAPPVFHAPFRGRLFTIWDVATLKRHPRVAGREQEPSKSYE